jgi:hypothetical protein
MIPAMSAGLLAFSTLAANSESTVGKELAALLGAAVVTVSVVPAGSARLAVSAIK